MSRSSFTLQGPGDQSGDHLRLQHDVQSLPATEHEIWMERHRTRCRSCKGGDSGGAVCGSLRKGAEPHWRGGSSPRRRRVRPGHLCQFAGDKGEAQLKQLVGNQIQFHGGWAEVPVARSFGPPPETAGAHHVRIQFRQQIRADAYGVRRPGRECERLRAGGDGLPGGVHWTRARAVPHWRDVGGKDREAIGAFEPRTHANAGHRGSGRRVHTSAWCATGFGDSCLAKRLPRKRILPPHTAPHRSLGRGAQLPLCSRAPQLGQPE